MQLNPNLPLPPFPSISRWRLCPRREIRISQARARRKVSPLVRKGGGAKGGDGEIRGWQLPSLRKYLRDAIIESSPATQRERQMRASWIVISSMAAGDVTSNARVRAPREIRRAGTSGIASCLFTRCSSWRSAFSALYRAGDMASRGKPRAPNIPRPRGG